MKGVVDMSFVFDFMAAFVIALNVSGFRRQMVAAILAGCAVSLLSRHVASLVFMTSPASSSAEHYGMVAGDMLAHSFIAAFAMILFRKS